MSFRMAIRRPHWTPGISCSMAACSSGGRSEQRVAATPVIPEPQKPSRITSPGLV